MNIPSFDQLLQPTLHALHTLGGTARIEDLNRTVIEETQLPADIAETQHVTKQGATNMTELEYRLHWARSYLKRCGLIMNVQRGFWQLTPLGKTTQTIDPGEIVRTVQEQLKQERKAQARREDSESQPALLEVTGSEENETTIEKEVIDAATSDIKSPTPDFPSYTEARHFLRIIDGTPYSLYRSMYNEIWSQRGNPQEQVDWADPNTWISERLNSDEKDLALRIWQESKEKVNPRYVRGIWYLATKHDLLVRDEEDVLRHTSAGKEFLSHPAGDTVAAIDEYEGMLVILRLVAERGPGKRSDFLTPYKEYCQSYTTFQSDSVIKSALYDRLKNLIDRGYVVRRGQSYEVADTGLTYLDAQPDRALGIRNVQSKQSDIRKIAKEMSNAARDQLAETLAEMHPFKFEGLIKLLLEEMGYDNVSTTSPTNDKGVDVVADIELGISSVREVIQVKRHKGNINRTVLDQLRGSLHRFDAVRGTIITTGRFSKGVQQAAFERGAAPITLIDGEKLLDLLTEYQIGVTKKPIEYYEFDPEKLTQFQ